MKSSKAFVSLAIITLLGALVPAYGAFAAGPQANLALSMQGPSDPVVAGTGAQYTATVTNQGPAQAVNVVMTLTVPPKMTFGTITPAASCSTSGSTLTCTLPLLDINGSSTWTITTALAPDARGTSLVSGKVGSSIADPDVNNNTHAVATTAQPEVDLLVQHVAPIAPAVAGAPLEYQLRIANAGRSTASNAQLHVTLPPNRIARVLRMPPGLGCDATATNIQCTLGTVAPAGVNNAAWLTSGTVITLTVEPKATLRLTDTLLTVASVRADEADTNPQNNFANQTLGVNRDTDLGVTIIDATPTPALAGLPLLYRLRVTNAGHSTGTHAVLQATLPPDRIARVISTTPGCQATTASMTCDLGTMAPAGVTNPGWLTSGTVITLEVQPKATVPLTDTLLTLATIHADELETNTANNTAQQSIGVAHDTDLGVAITSAGPDPAIAGGTVQYALRIANTGPSMATNTVLEATLPPNRIERVIAMSPGYTCQATPAVVRCALGPLAPQGMTVPGWIASGSVITMTVQPKPTLPLTDSLVFDVAIMGDEQEANITNNTTRSTLHVDRDPDLGVAVATATAERAIGNQPLTYLLRVTNDGHSTGSNVRLDVSLPSNQIERVVAMSPGYECRTSAAQVACALGTLAPAGMAVPNALPSGTVITLTVLPKATLRPTDTLLIVAAVRGDEREANTGNNTAQVVTGVDYLTDLGVTLDAVVPNHTTSTPLQAIAGVPVVYQIGIGNGGHAMANHVAVELTLPPNRIERVLSTSPGYGCRATSTGVACMLNTLAPLDASVTRSSTTITVAVLPKATLLLTDTLLAAVSVTGDEWEVNTRNNTVAQTLTVAHENDLGMGIDGPKGFVQSGSIVTYTLAVTNAGPSISTGVVLTGNVPTNGFVVEHIEGTGCALTGSKLECRLGSLLPGQTATVTLRGRPLANALTPLNVTASVRSDDNEPSGATAPNSATVSGSIQPYVVALPLVVR